MDRSEFKCILDDPHLSADLVRLEVPFQGVDHEELFDCFDEDGDDHLHWSEFWSGLEELRKGVNAKQQYKLQATLQRVVTTGRAPSQPKGAVAHMSDAVQEKLAVANDKLVRVEDRVLSLQADLRNLVELWQAQCDEKH